MSGDNQEHLGVGIHYGVPASRYHADPCPTPSLSSSCARTILERSIEHAALEHPRLKGKGREATKAMRFGSAVHAIQSGDESEIVQSGDWDSYRTNAAKAWRDGVLASGRVPMLTHEMDDVRPCAESLISKVGAGITESPFADYGKSEVTIIWKEGDVFCRARLDRLLINPDGSLYATVYDWKTTTDVSDDAIEKKIAADGLHIQEAFYKRGLSAVLPKYAGRISFVFGFVENKAPYIARRVCLSEAFHHIGEREAQRAIHAWQLACSTNDFTDHSNEYTMHVSPPNWLQAKFMEESQ